MSGPFKMKGHSLPGINQKSEGKNLADGRSKSSALQKQDAGEDKKKVDFNDPKVQANYEKHKDNPAYRDALNKKSGGETSYDKNKNTSTTKKSK